MPHSRQMNYGPRWSGQNMFQAKVTRGLSYDKGMWAVPERGDYYMRRHPTKWSVMVVATGVCRVEDSYTAAAWRREWWNMHGVGKCRLLAPRNYEREKARHKAISLAVAKRSAS